MRGDHEELGVSVEASQRRRLPVEQPRRLARDRAEDFRRRCGPCDQLGHATQGSLLFGDLPEVAAGLRGGDGSGDDLGELEQAAFVVARKGSQRRAGDQGSPEPAVDPDGTPTEAWTPSPAAAFPAGSSLSCPPAQASRSAGPGP